MIHNICKNQVVRTLFAPVVLVCTRRAKYHKYRIASLAAEWSRIPSDRMLKKVPEVQYRSFFFCLPNAGLRFVRTSQLHELSSAYLQYGRRGRSCLPHDVIVQINLRDFQIGGTTVLGGKPPVLARVSGS